MIDDEEFAVLTALYMQRHNLVSVEANIEHGDTVIREIRVEELNNSNFTFYNKVIIGLNTYKLILLNNKGESIKQKWLSSSTFILILDSIYKTI